MPLPSPAERVVADVIAGLLAEITPGRSGAPVDMRAALDRELGLGSLERVELLLRLERAVGARLPERVLAEAATPHDLALAISSLDLGASAAPPSDAAPAVRHEAEAARAAPATVKTLVDALRWHVERSPERVHIHLREDDDLERPISYGQLWRGGLDVAAGLRDLGVSRGHTVALLLRTEVAFFEAYIGVLLAGGVPVPLYPPFRADQIEEYAERQANILNNAQTRVLLTFARAERVAGSLRGRAPLLQTVTTVSALKQEGTCPPLPEVAADDLALIQYTSGSTGQPKGVALSHTNLLSNIRAFGAALDVRPDDVAVTWLPLYHDMGLIGKWFGTLYHGLPLVAMSPLAFLTRPVRWLEAFHTHRGTLSAAPNFAYDLAVRKVSDEEAARFDLRSWRCALNGAEAVSAATIDRFVAKFAGSGIRREAIMPVYGLAEATLCVTAPPPGLPPRVDRIARDHFERRREIVAARRDDQAPMTFVGCGRAIPGHAFRIADDAGRDLPERHEGRIQFRGPSAMRGYYRNPEASLAVMAGDGWVDSGDLGYVADGDLFITGRKKDVIIAGGRNIYPQEVEDAVTEVPGVRRGCVAALGVPDAATGTERLVIVVEARTADDAALEKLRAAIVAAVVDVVAVPPDVVHVARPGAIPKTSSGKIRRAATRDRFVAGTLDRPRQWPVVQMARLAVDDVAWRLGRAADVSGSLAYTFWVVACLMAIVPVAWVRLLVTAEPLACRRIVRGACRRIFQLARCPLDVTGLDHLQAASPAICVANHASYLDAAVFLATLPDTVRFAAKAQLVRYPLLGTVIRKCRYVEVHRGRADAADDLTRTLQANESISIFPEGTFVRAPGVMPFRLGGFRAAVDAGRPVVPIALRGPRDIWPDESWLFRRGRVEMEVGPALAPGGSGWQAMVRLRDDARRWVSDHCGEPMVDRSIVKLDAPGF